MGELWVPDKYREVQKDSTAPFFASTGPRAGGALTPAIAASQAEIARQGAISTSPFSPGLPLEPFEGVDGMPRLWDFPTGYNIKARADRDGRYSFERLKFLTDNYSVARLCIQHRIDDVRSLDWTIVPADGAEKNIPDIIAIAKRHLKKPDGVTPFRGWLHKYLEDVLRYDAGTLVKRRNKAGRVIGLDVVQGSTIAPVVDRWGRPPAGDAPAYVQFVNGLPWKWFTQDSVIYRPFRPQTDSMYGYAPIEAAMMEANTHLRFQDHWLTWFTAGNIPDGFAILPPNVGTTPEDRERWEDAWNAHEAGNTEAKSQLRFMPNGMTFEWPKEHTFDDVFPIFLMKIVCAVFSVTPQDIGFTDDVNRATGETQADVQFRVGTRPLLKHIEEVLTDYLQEDLGLPVQFQFDEGKESEDRVETAKMWEIGIKNGAVSSDEMREEVFGREIDQERPTPRFIYTNTQGPIPLKSLLEVAGPVDPDTTAPDDDALASGDLKPFAGTPGVLPHKSPGGVQFTRAPIDPDDPEHPSNEHEVPGTGVVAPPAPTAPEPKPAQPVGKALELTQDELRTLSQWRHNARTLVKRGNLPRRFKDAGLSAEVEHAVWAGLRGARTREAVDEAFQSVIRKAGDGDPKGWRADPPNPEPQHGMDLSLTDYYRPEVQQALQSLWTEAQIAQYTESVVGAGSTEAAMMRSLIAMSFGQGMDTADLEAAMGSLWADAYRSGALAAAQQLGHGDPPEWASWKPGLTAENVLRDGGWAQAFTETGYTLKGIANESLHLIGSAIEEGLNAGSSIDKIARSIRATVGSADRAELIAHTETARMLTRASIYQYQQANVTQWDLVISGSACSTCINVASANPHSMSETGSLAPVHPRCRCAVAPVTRTE